MINPNSAFIEELYQKFLRDPDSVSPEWRKYFKDNSPENFPNLNESGILETVFKEKELENKYIPPKQQIIKLQPGDTLEAFSLISTRIAENMEESLNIPTATSQRMIPVKALEENRRIINKYLAKMKRPKVSYTHILAWAIIRSLVKYPHMNDAFILKDDKPFRLKHQSINIGLAVDVTRRDGSRLLLVPNVKNSQDLNFSEFISAFEDMIIKARTHKIEPDDMQGTTITLTNPGMIGTTASAPRLMKGQGLIVAVGSIDYPQEFSSVRTDFLTNFALSKVTAITSTYDHRIIQGAESAEFLAYLHNLLIGKDLFYDNIFATLRIPFEPVRWSVDITPDIKNRQQNPRNDIEKGAHVVQMINAYRVRGHLLADVNPLGLQSYYYPELDPAFYGFTIWDLDRIFHADDAWENNNLPLRDIIELLRNTYCGTVGIEFMHIQDSNKKEWIKNKFESSQLEFELSSDNKKRIFEKLASAEEFENFLHTKFVGHKRFSLEGSESIIVLLDRIFEQAADTGLDSIMLGMAHRGRLNVLVNNIGKNLQTIFSEFDGDIDPLSWNGSGDVKYHLGDRGTYTSQKENSITIELAPNPSHLEIINPVVEGMARARGAQIGDKRYNQVLPVLIHGDSAFAGQGIIQETLNLAQLEGYKTGGTIHIIINNQIGFTTTVEESRSAFYASDIAKMTQMPILHVNGNEPEAVAFCAEFAYQYRTKYNSDIIIDLLCYRKYGHNEADEPSYTQPLLYKKIRSMPPVGKKYEKELISQGVLTEEETTQIFRKITDEYYQVFNNRNLSKEEQSNLINNQDSILKIYKTSVDFNSLLKISKAITTIPDTFKPNPKAAQLFKKRALMIESEKPSIDWAMAESLAFGTILMDKTPIRFSGEDTRRGTFSQRHATLTDIESENIYISLNNINKNQTYLDIYDSPLSELAVLGFEYGYSIISHESLTIWEAQFGDFANMAQPIFDQFISCGQTKWGKNSNIVILLPHSYDGQGPEHSSCRIERYLQLCADENMIICNLSTPAQYFHALRRQILIQPNKPLIIATPKSMLRHPLAVSSSKDLTDSNFMEIIDDPQILNNKSEITKILICSGKIYYDLLEEKNKRQNTDTNIIRIEQLYPFHDKLFSEIISKYTKIQSINWVQEEPKNMGAFHQINDEITSLIPQGLKLNYIGRKSSASTATGYLKTHLAEQKMIVEEAYNG